MAIICSILAVLSCYNSIVLSLFALSLTIFVVTIVPTFYVEVVERADRAAWELPELCEDRVGGH